MKSTNSNAFGTTIGSRPVHSKARAVFRFFLYSGSFVMFTVLTWRQDPPGDDPRSSLVAHGFFVVMGLVVVIGEAMALHAYNALETRRTVTDQSLGEEIFGTLVITLFMILSVGSRFHALPAAVYANHLEGVLRVVFCALIFIILWSGGIFDRR